MPWRCSSLMMRRSVQARARFGLLAFAAVFVAGWVAAGAEAVVVTAGAAAAAGAGAGAAAGAGAGIAGGRSTYLGASTAGATSLICVVEAAVVVVCEAALWSVAADVDRLRSPAWADAEARS